MKPAYQYTPSPVYIDNLSFDYIETYSFQRGLDYDEHLKEIKPEYDRLKVRKEKRNDLGTSDEERLAELHDLLGFTQYLINDNGRFYPSAEKTHTFQNDDPVVEKLKRILKTEVREVLMLLCAPVYRDAVVFYDQDHQIVSVLNVCLSCLNMETQKFHHIQGDYETYTLLNLFFHEIGHNVEHDHTSTHR